MGIIYWILIGGASGWLAGKIWKGGSFGLLTNVILGIIGSVVGGWAFGLLGISTSSGMLGSLITSVVGALIVLYIAKLFR